MRHIPVLLLLPLLLCSCYSTRAIKYTVKSPTAVVVRDADNRVLLQQYPVKGTVYIKTKYLTPGSTITVGDHTDTVGHALSKDLAKK
jgi:hypothetical protein